MFAFRRSAACRVVGAVILATSLALGLTGCGEPEFTGVWKPDDGSGLKTIADGGQCSGMYYNNGKPLDIGGTMTCTFSSGSDGAYVLVVRQPPNERSYTVEFPDDDTMVLRSGDTTVVTLTRQ